MPSFQTFDTLFVMNVLKIKFIIIWISCMVFVVDVRVKAGSSWLLLVEQYLTFFLSILFAASVTLFALNKVRGFFFLN